MVTDSCAHFLTKVQISIKDFYKLVNRQTPVRLNFLVISITYLSCGLSNYWLTSSAPSNPILIFLNVGGSCQVYLPGLHLHWQGQFYVRCPIHIRMHIGQKQRPFWSNDHCHIGVNITPNPTSLSTMRKVLIGDWNRPDQCLFLSKMTRTVFTIPGSKQNPVPGKHQGQEYLPAPPPQQDATQCHFNIRSTLYIHMHMSKG